MYLTDQAYTQISKKSHAFKSVYILTHIYILTSRNDPRLHYVNIIEHFLESWLCILCLFLVTFCSSQGKLEISCC